MTAAVVLVFAAILSFMLITRKTAEDVSIVTRSMWRHNRDRLQQRAVARRIKRQMAEAQAAELAAQQPQIRIEAPVQAALPAGTQAALPAGLVGYSNAWRWGGRLGAGLVAPARAVLVALPLALFSPEYQDDRQCRRWHR